MNHLKIKVLARQISLRIRRERSFRIKLTIFLCLSALSLVFFLATFVSDRIKKYLQSDEFYYFSNITQHKTLSLQQEAIDGFLASGGGHGGLIDWIVPKKIWHSMSDGELLWGASMVPHRGPDPDQYPFKRTAKVAFMFLVTGRLPLAPLWEVFFKGNEGLYSIYLHTSPEFTDEPPRGSVFFKRRIPSKAKEWGRSSMIDAERRLLANALLDFSNERFVLLSDTCIPLFNFTTIYTYLLNSHHSFIHSFHKLTSVGRDRILWTMSPSNNHNQLFAVHRKVAVEVVSNMWYYNLFKHHCKPPCYIENYLLTRVTKICPAVNSNRTIIWVDLSRWSSRPRMFARSDISEEFLSRIRHGFNCTYNGGVTNVCFLFAREFDHSTLEPLLQLAPKLFGFDSWLSTNAIS